MVSLPLPQNRPTDRKIQSATARWLALPVLLYLAAILFPVGFNVGTLNLNGVRLLLLVLIVPLTFRLLMGHYGRLLWTDILFFLHILWLMVAMVVNNPDRAVIFFGSQAIEFIGAYVLGRAFIRSREDFIALCRALVLMVCLTLPFALIEAGTGRSLILRAIDALPGLRASEPLTSSPRLGLYRVHGIHQHPILYGLFCSFIFSFAFVALKGIYSPTTRYMLSAAVALCAFLSLSSGPLLAMILQVLLIFWAFTFQRVQARWWLLVALFIVMYIAIDILSTRTPMQVFLTYATFSPHTAWNRLHIFNYGMENVWANPLFGLGLNDWARPSWMHSGSMDNFWLVNAVRYGILGFAFLAAGYLIALWQIGRREFDADPVLWQLRRGWMFAFVGLSFTLTTVHIWSSVYSFVFFVFGAGMWMVNALPNADIKTDSKDGLGAGLENEGQYSRNSPHQSTDGVMTRGKTGPYSRFPVNNKRTHDFHETL